MSLTDTQLKTLRALMDRIIPPDDVWPGATEAGVEHYIIRQIEVGDLRDRAAMISDSRDSIWWTRTARDQPWVMVWRM